MSFGPGDRVRWDTTDDDGFPVVVYGFVGEASDDGATVTVMLDGDITGELVVDPRQLAAVSVTSIVLHLEGADLLHDPDLRDGLVNLWSAEADQAGLEIPSIDRLDVPVCDTCGHISLAEIWAAGRPWVLTARPEGPEAVSVRADPI